MGNEDEENRSTFQSRFPEGHRRKAVILFFLQITLIALLACTMIVVYIVQSGDMRLFYLVITGGGMILIGLSLEFNLAGKYEVSSHLTALSMLLGPWISIVSDSSIAKGDSMPLVYIVLPVQFCALFMSKRVTISVAVIQIAVLAIFIECNTELHKTNWASLICFVLFASVLGIISNFLVRKQMKQIETDKARLLENERIMHNLMVKDSLTNLYNRRYMEETLKNEIGNAVRRDLGLGIIMADVDGFKMINDTYGHVLGDAILAQIADILSSGIRSNDVACRYGGDEFVLILPGCTGSETERIAGKQRVDVSEAAFSYEGINMGRITLSIGVASLPENGICENELIRAADKALYSAKSEGRNKVVIAM